MRTALLSVFHKDGIVEFARDLQDIGWNIIASGGTARTLTAAGIQVRDVAELVGGGAILGHRVVTLSREIHAGLLAKDNQEDRNELDDLGLEFIDLVCVDLYPLMAEINDPNATRESVIEKTDIGGPTMLRSAAKGRRIVICDPADRSRVIEWLKAGEPDSDNFIIELCAKAEMVVADYCLASARYHSNGIHNGIVGTRVLECRYGENGWQTPAGLFSTSSSDPLALDQFKVVAGAVPSYNNLCDLDRLLQTMTHIAAAFDLNCSEVPLIALGAKHGNCCGAAIGTASLPTMVLEKMLDGDPRAIFGGLVMVNFPIVDSLADTLLSYGVLQGRRMLDGIIAPYFTDTAIEKLKRKADKCRFITNPALSHLSMKSMDTSRRIRFVRGGFLAQPNYIFVLNLDDPIVVKHSKLSPGTKHNMLLAWAIGSTSNSNTITIVRDNKLIGNGVGQQDRVTCCNLAISRANDAHHQLQGSVAYSDSFFPFSDGPEALAKAGVTTILASSGSVKDTEVEALFSRLGVNLCLIPDPQGRGFFGH